MSLTFPIQVGEASLRAYEDSDFDAVVSLWKATGLFRWYNDPEDDIARFRRAGNAEVIVAEAAGSVVGTVCVGHDGHRGWVYYLGVSPSFGGRGLGRALIKAAEEWLRARDIPKIMAMVRSSNRPVLDFYRALDFERDPVDVIQRWLIDHGSPPEGESDGMLEVTITYLEMHEAPAGPPPSRPGNLNTALIRAHHPSVAFYRFLYAGVGDDWIWYERRLLDDAALADIVQDESVELYVLYVSGVPAGYFEIDRREAGLVDLAFFGLMPDFVGLGLGPWLLRSALDTAWSSEPEKVTVNTCTLDHPKALGVYQKAGFTPTKRETIRIKDPRILGLCPYTERQVV